MTVRNPHEFGIRAQRPILSGANLADTAARRRCKASSHDGTNSFALLGEVTHVNSVLTQEWQDKYTPVKNGEFAASRSVRIGLRVLRLEMAGSRRGRPSGNEVAASRSRALDSVDTVF